MKRIFMLLIVMLFGFTLVGCNKSDEYSKDSIIVTIRQEYEKQFLNEEFTDDDFNYENIRRVEYGTWYEKTNHGFMVIYLKNTGKKQVLSAIEHFKKLSFVYNVEKNYTISI